MIHLIGVFFVQRVPDAVRLQVAYCLMRPPYSSSVKIKIIIKPQPNVNHPKHTKLEINLEPRALPNL
jgi:hypothetical protein